MMDLRRCPLRERGKGLRSFSNNCYHDFRPLHVFILSIYMKGDMKLKETLNLGKTNFNTCRSSDQRASWQRNGMKLNFINVVRVNEGKYFTLHVALRILARSIHIGYTVVNSKISLFVLSLSEFTHHIFQVGTHTVCNRTSLAKQGLNAKRWTLLNT